MVDLIAEEFVIASPHLTVGRWASQFAAINEILDSLVAKHRVDPDRVYVTGFSRGGYGTWDYALQECDRLAAIAPISGGPTLSKDLSILKDLPMWVFHNIGDPTVPFEFSKNAVEAVEHATASKFLRYTSEPSDDQYLGHTRNFTEYAAAGHDAWSRTYSHPHIHLWFLRQKRQER